MDNQYEARNSRNIKDKNSGISAFLYEPIGISLYNPAQGKTEQSEIEIVIRMNTGNLKIDSIVGWKRILTKSSEWMFYLVQLLNVWNGIEDSFTERA